MPAPSSEEDTLLAVQVVVIDGTTKSFEGMVKFKIHMDNIETGERRHFFVSTNSHGYYFLRGIPQGTYSIREFRTFGMNHEETYDLQIGKYLEVKDGHLTVFPGKLTVYIFNVEPDKNNYYLDYWIREMDENQITRIEHYLENEEHYGLWE